MLKGSWPRAGDSTGIVAVIWVATCVLTACADEPGQEPPEDWSGTVSLAEPGSAECSVVFEPTGVRLQGNAAGTVPDPLSVARAPDGHYFTTTSAGNEVAVWSPQGEFLQTFGRSGEGPGELDRFFGLLAADDGTLHVIEDDRWSRFSPGGEYLGGRGLASLGSRIGPSGAMMLGDGSLIVQPSSPTRHHFVVVPPDGGDGELATSFGSVESRDAAPGEAFASISVWAPRSIARSSPGSFWAAPSRGSPSGYTLEEWSREGELLRTLRRTPPWFPLEAPPAVSVHFDPSGRLLTKVILNDEVRFDLIDLDTPEIIASESVRPRSEGGVSPAGFFQGTRLGYFLDRDDLGLGTITILRYRILGADGMASRECEAGSA